MATQNNAPTKRVWDFLEYGGGCLIDLPDGITIVAQHFGPQEIETVREDGTPTRAWLPRRFMLFWHRGENPAYRREEYDSLQGLANKMRRISPLTHWKMVKNA